MSALGSSSSGLFAPAACVDVYPFEGGMYSIQGANLLSLTVTKSTTAPNTFEMLLPPGGPFGLNSRPGWLDIITPLSFVVISLQRGLEAEVVMLGVTEVIGETQAWQVGNSTTRSLRITGLDLGYFFTQTNYYSLWFLGATAAGALGQATFNDPSAGVALLADGLISGTPASIAKTWYTKIMAGTKGILSNTFLPYRQSQVKFSDAMRAFFEEFDVTIPFADFFIASEGSWMAKFKSIFPFPWYEVFIDTRSPTYLPSKGQAPATPGMSFTSSAINAVGVPTFIARRNPIPKLMMSGGSSPAPSGVDATLWEGLPLHTLNPGGVLYETFQYDEAQVLNFFTLNPTWMQTLWGSSTGSNIPFMFSLAALGDASSIRRYGFRPMNGSISWFADPGGASAQTGHINLQDLYAGLAGQAASYYLPTPLMPRASVKTTLRPGVFIGDRFQYTPAKVGIQHDFYIEGLTHQYIFGGASTTTLMLSRGLPTAIYNQSGNGGILQALLQGNAYRVNGTYVSPLPATFGTPLQAITGENMAAFLGKISPLYSTAQGISTAS